MKLIRHFLPLFGVMLIWFLPSVQAQKQVTAQEVQASPAKYNGARVFVYVQMVDFPAVHINKDKGFSEFIVITTDDASRGSAGPQGRRPGGDFAGGIIVRVPSTEVPRFSETHAIKAGQPSSGARKKITATFRACRSGKGGYLDMTDGSAADVDPLPAGGPHHGLGPRGPRPSGDKPGLENPDQPQSSGGN